MRNKKKRNLSKEELRVIEEEKRKPSAEQLLIDFRDNTIQQIADKYGVRYRTAELWLWEEDITKQKARGYQEIPPKEEIEELYRTHTQKEVAEHYGIPKSMLLKWFEYHKIKKPGRTYKERVSMPDAQELIDLLATPREIMKLYGVSRPTAVNWIKKRGIDRYFILDDIPREAELREKYRGYLERLPSDADDAVDAVSNYYRVKRDQAIYWLKWYNLLEMEGDQE